MKFYLVFFIIYLLSAEDVPCINKERPNDILWATIIRSLYVGDVIWSIFVVLEMNGRKIKD